MGALARMGARILVPAPAFYLRPQSVDDIVDYLMWKAIDALGIEGLELPEALQYRGMPEGRLTEE